MAPGENEFDTPVLSALHLTQLCLQSCEAGIRFFLKFSFIDFRERETLICCSHLCIHRLILVCALTGDGTCSLGVSW